MEIKTKLLIIFILFTLASCQGKLVVSPSEIWVMNLFPKIDFNHVITLESAIDFETKKPFEFSQGDLIYLDIHNLTNKSIWFPLDYGVSIYLHNEEQDEWEEIENITTYHASEEGQVLSPKSDAEYQPGFLTIYPNIENKDQIIKVRIVIVGNVMKGNTITEEEVGSYLDIALQP